MSQFSFSVRGASSDIADQIVDLPSANAAAAQAVRYAGAALGIHPSAFLDDDEWLVDAKDESGLLLLTIAVSLTRAPALRR